MALTAGLLSTIGTSGVLGAERRRTSSDQAEDQIEIAGHVSLKGLVASRMVTGTHWRKNFLYIQLAERPALVTVDVTEAGKPRILGEVSLPPSRDTHVSLVVGSAVLVTDTEEPAPPQPPHSVTVLNLADPVHPKVLREFDRVSGLLKDEPRGLIYLVNDTGLWILRQRPAADVDTEQQYGRDVLYNH